MKKNMSRFLTILAAITLTTGTIPYSVSAASKPKDTKEETVYVKTDANGNIDDVIVSDWLKNDTAGSGQTIKDKSILNGIENVKGNETFTEANKNEVTWNSSGKDIYYQGSTDKELPVSVDVTYYLNDKEISPKELLGKSGKVKIRYDYTNNSTKVTTIDGTSTVLYTPFTMITGVILSTDHFSNVKATNGKVISDGSKHMVIGIGFPGLEESLNLKNSSLSSYEIPDYFEITADAKDFQMSVTATVANSDTLSDFNLDKVDNLDDLTGSLDTLSNASTKLVNGSGDLVDGINKLANGSVKLKDGMNKLNTSTKKLADGLNTLNDKKGALVTGSSKLASGSSTLASGAVKLFNGSTSLVSGTKKVETGSSKLASGSSSLVSGSNQLVTGSSSLVSGSSQLLAGSQKLANGTSQLEAATKNLPTAINSLQSSMSSIETLAGKMPSASEQQQLKTALGTIESTLKGMDFADTSGLETIVGKLGSIYSALPSGSEKDDLGDCITDLKAEIKEIKINSATNEVKRDKLVAGVQEIESKLNDMLSLSNQLASSLTKVSTTSKSLFQSASALPGAIKTVNSGAQSLAKNQKTLNDGTKTLATGTKKLASGAKTVSNGTKTLSKGTKSLSKGAKKLSKGSKTLSSGAKTLSKNQKKLATGTKALGKGINTAAHGGILLSGGANTLASSGTTMVNGISALQTGAKQLNTGMKEFDQSGIQKLTNLIEDNVQTTMDRAEKVIDLGKDYDNFSGKTKDMNGSVKFMIETEEITK